MNDGVIGIVFSLVYVSLKEFGVVGSDTYTWGIKDFHKCWSGSLAKRRLCLGPAGVINCTPLSALSFWVCFLERVATTKTLPDFATVCPCLPVQAHSLPLCCECCVLCSFWMVFHPLLPLHWLSPCLACPTTRTPLFKVQNACGPSGLSSCTLSCSLGWKPLLRAPQLPGLPF